MKKILVFLLVFSFVTGPVHADWVNDWIVQKSVSSPNYFHTQNKGYGSFGSYSARWQNQTEQIATFTPPRFNMGCGGIDMFMGGYSFLKADHIVERLKKMMGPAAAAFAYGIAMSVLNAQAKGVLDNLQTVTDFLNNLQLSECGVSNQAKALGKAAGDGILEATSLDTQKFLSEKGLASNWFEVSTNNKNTTTAAVMNNSGTNASDQVVGCPAEMTDVFFTPGSILRNIGGIKGYSTEQINLIRGLVGDVEIQGGGAWTYIQSNPCEQNANANIINSMIYGKIHVKVANQTCAPPANIIIGAVSYPNLNFWVASMLQSIGYYMNSGTPLTAEQIAFLGMTPLPVMEIMKTTIASAGTNAAAEIQTTASMYSEYVASLISYSMVGDLYAGIQAAIFSAKEIRRKKQGATNPNDQINCQVETADGAIRLLEDIQKNLTILSGDMYTAFGVKIEELNASLKMNDAALARSSHVKKKVQALFGSRTASSLRGS